MGAGAAIASEPPAPEGPPPSNVNAIRTDVITLKGMPPGRAIALYKKVIGVTRDARIAEGQKPNTVVIKDKVWRLDQYHSLLQILDVPGANAVRIFLRPIRHVWAREMKTMLEQIIDRWRKGDHPMATIIMVPDDRGAQLIVRATSDQYEALDKLIRRLDVPDMQRRRALRYIPDAPPGELLR